MLLYEHLAKTEMLLAVLVCTCLKIAKYNFWSCMNWLSELASFEWLSYTGLWTDVEVEMGLCALIRRLVVTARETWFTLHNISRLLFHAAGRQPSLRTCLLFFFFFAWSDTLSQICSGLCITVTDCSVQRWVPSHVQSAGICWVSNVRKCMIVNMIP